MNIIQLTDANGHFPIQIVAEQVVSFEQARGKEADIHLTSGLMIRVAESVEEIRAALTGQPRSVEIKSEAASSSEEAQAAVDSTTDAPDGDEPDGPTGKKQRK